MPEYAMIYQDMERKERWEKALQTLKMQGKTTIRKDILGYD